MPGRGSYFCSLVHSLSPSHKNGTNGLSWASRYCLHCDTHTFSSSMSKTSALKRLSRNYFSNTPFASAWSPNLPQPRKKWLTKPRRTRVDIWSERSTTWSQAISRMSRTGTNTGCSSVGIEYSTSGWHTADTTTLAQLSKYLFISQPQSGLFTAYSDGGELRLRQLMIVGDSC